MHNAKQGLTPEFADAIRNQNVVGIFAGHVHQDAGRVRTVDNGRRSNIPVILSGSAECGTYLYVEFEKRHYNVAAVNAASGTPSFLSPGWTCDTFAPYHNNRGNGNTLFTYVFNNSAPQIDWIAPATLQEGEEAWFRAWVVDPDGGTFNYTWDLGDGTTSSGSAASGTTPPLLHTYANTGTYTVTLTVDDGYGGVTTRSIDVVVGGSPLVGTGLLRSVGSGNTQCMDVTSYAADTPVTLYPCYNGSSNQWKFVDGRIENVGSGGMCMDVRSYATHTPVILNYCYGGGGQQWRPRADGTISSVGSGNTQCIDLTSYATGTQVKLYPCYDAVSQKWSR